MTMARFTIYVMLLGATKSSLPAGRAALCAAIPAPGPVRRRRRRRRDYIMTMASFTIYVMLLGVKVVNSCRQRCAMRCNPRAGAGTQAPALAT